MLSAIPDHYDDAVAKYDSDVANLRKFIDETREDGEETLSVEAAEKLEMEKELYRLVRKIESSKEENRTGTMGLDHPLDGITNPQV